jgi:hypothetical protein
VPSKADCETHLAEWLPNPKLKKLNPKLRKDTGLNCRNRTPIEAENAALF